MAEHFTDAGALSYVSQIQLNTGTSAPPTNAYIGVDDQLQVFIASSTNNAQASVFARILLADGTIVPNNWLVSAVNGRLGRNFYFSLAEGFLLSLSVQSVGSQQSGETFVRVTLMRGTQVLNSVSLTLLAGYVYNQNVISWPGSPILLQSAGRGKMRVVTGTTPGAGAEISEVVPSFALWRLVNFSFTLTTTAGGSARGPLLFFDDGVTNFTAVQYTVATPAANAVNYQFGTGYGHFDQGNGFPEQPLPSDLYLPAGFRIRTVTLGMLAGDQYGNIRYLVEEWLS